mmetsp:Transcript_16502/g.23078  ORF Transcript_16502/g.23078 Transcript_16502/m.23078 type:complete len:238 (-) Transcript_16502:2276-2989(-)
MHPATNFFAFVARRKKAVFFAANFVTSRAKAKIVPITNLSSLAILNPAPFTAAATISFTFASSKFTETTPAILSSPLLNSHDPSDFWSFTRAGKALSALIGPTTSLTFFVPKPRLLSALRFILGLLALSFSSINISFDSSSSHSSDSKSALNTANPAGASESLPSASERGMKPPEGEGELEKACVGTGGGAPGEAALFLLLLLEVLFMPLPLPPPPPKKPVTVCCSCAPKESLEEAP